MSSHRLPTWALARCMLRTILLLATSTKALDCVTEHLPVHDPEVAQCLQTCGACDYTRLINASSMLAALRLARWMEYQRPVVEHRLEAAANASVAANASATVFFGDSLFAMAADKDEALLCASRAAPCANAGSGYDTFRSAFGRAWMVCGARPGLIYVLFGTNDLLQGASVDAVASRAARLVRYLRRCSDAAVVLVSLPPHAAGHNHPFDERAVNARYADVAASENASFCDIHAPLADDGRGALRGDGLHLTIEGYAILAATLARCRIRSV